MIAYSPDTSKLERGMLRAAVEGVQVRRLHGSTWQASSVSRPGVTHLIVNGACSCEGYSYHGMCKHVAATMLATDATHTCEHCGSDRSVERDTAGHYYCADRVRCWSRWDRAHGF